MNTFPLEALETLYNSLIASYLNYGLLLWGTESHKVFTLQKKAIRLPTKHIFKDLEAFCLRHVVIVFKNVCIILL